MTLDLVQGSDAWLAARLGRATASRIADVVAKAKTGSGWGESRRKYRKQLVIERITGRPHVGFKNETMQRGNDLEPLAREEYIKATFNDVAEVGFVPHPRIEMAGASPDGLVGLHGLLQIKCPLDDAHYDTLKTDKIDGGYIKQMQWEMCCADRSYCDFVSFNPGWPPELQLKIILVERDDKLIAELEKEVVIFLKEVDEEVKALTDRYDMRLAA
jgi:putative phage-type endonuclease